MNLHDAGVTGVTPAQAILAAVDPASADPRLFIALWPDAGVRRALADCRDRQAWPAGSRPTPDAKLHLTLHFLGRVAEARLDELASALALRLPPFELVLDRVEAWPQGLVVLGPGAAPPVLQQWHDELARVLRRLALPVEARRFRPHVTLARRAGTAGAWVQPPPVHWAVHDHVLVASTAGGPYRLLARLGGQAHGHRPRVDPRGGGPAPMG